MYTYTFYYDVKINNNDCKQIKIQLIKMIYPDKLSIINNFDIDSCCILRTLNGEYYTNPRGKFALKYRLNCLNFDKLSAATPYRLCKYNYRGFAIFIPFFSHFKQNMVRDFSENTNIKQDEIFSNYILNDYPIYNIKESYSKPISDINPGVFIKYDENAINDCFNKIKLSCIKDWYPKKPDNILYKPIFTDEVFQCGSIDIPTTVKYQNVVYKSLKNIQMEDNFDHLIYIIKEFLKDSNAFAFGDLIFNLISGVRNNKYYINIIGNEDLYDKLHKFLKRFYKDISRHLFTLSVDNLIIYVHDLTSIEEAFSIDHFLFYRIAMRYEDDNFVYYTTDRTLWHIQNKIVLIPEFNTEGYRDIEE